MLSKRGRGSPAGTGTSATGARQIPFSLIGADVVIRGDVEASVDLHIDGSVAGDIACATLVQGSDGRITGNIRAKVARIAGQVDGAIEAEELVVETSARISGDLTYGTLSIAPGAQLSGHLTHRVSGGTELKLVRSDV